DRSSRGALDRRPTQPLLDTRDRRFRSRVLDHDDGRLPATAPAPLHGFRGADRARARRRGRVRPHPVAGDRALERQLPYSARAPPPVHACRPRADGLLPPADALHAEPLDDDAHRPRLLLRILRVRAPVPRALPGSATAVDVRPGPGDPARVAWDRARLRPGGRWLPAEGV